jgi:hypothetical protein
VAARNGRSMECAWALTHHLQVVPMPGYVPD